MKARRRVARLAIFAVLLPFTVNLCALRPRRVSSPPGQDFESRRGAPRGSSAGRPARLLPGGDWVVSWSGAPIVTEAAPNGTRQFALHFSGERQSYRAIPILPSELKAGDLRSGMDKQAK